MCFTSRDALHCHAVLLVNTSPYIASPYIASPYIASPYIVIAPPYIAPLHCIQYTLNTPLIALLTVSLCAMLELLPPEDAWVADPRHPPTSPDSDPSLVVCSLTRARHEAALAAARLALWRHCRGEEGVVGGLGVAETAAQLCSAGTKG